MRTLRSQTAAAAALSSEFDSSSIKNESVQLSSSKDDYSSDSVLPQQSGLAPALPFSAIPITPEQDHESARTFPKDAANRLSSHPSRRRSSRLNGPPTVPCEEASIRKVDLDFGVKRRKGKKKVDNDDASDTSVRFEVKRKVKKLDDDHTSDSSESEFKVAAQGTNWKDDAVVGASSIDKGKRKREPDDDYDCTADGAGNTASISPAFITGIRRGRSRNTGSGQQARVCGTRQRRGQPLVNDMEEQGDDCDVHMQNADIKDATYSRRRLSVDGVATEPQDSLPTCSLEINLQGFVADADAAWARQPYTLPLIAVGDEGPAPMDKGKGRVCGHARDGGRKAQSLVIEDDDKDDDFQNVDSDHLPYELPYLGAGPQELLDGNHASTSGTANDAAGDGDTHGQELQGFAAATGEAEAGPQEGPYSPPSAKRLLGRRSRGGAEAARARFLQIARNRAAHFAHFDANGNEPPAGAPPPPFPAATNSLRQAGGLPPRQEPESESQAQVDWPGPFSTARQLVANRAAAAASRRTKANKVVSLVDWSPSRVPGDVSFSRRSRPSLQELSLAVLANNAEGVVSLDGVPDFLKARISVTFCQRRKMDFKALALFFQGEPSEINAPDCTLVSEPELTQMMAQLSACRLEVLNLGLCGRALSDQCLQATIAHNSNFLPLKSISLCGAYRLSDVGLESLLRVSPSVTHLDLSHCSFLSEDGIKAVVGTVGGTLQTLILNGCNKLDARKFISEVVKMPKLQKLSLAEVGGVDDEVVSELCVQLGSSLRDLSLAHCSLLTDAAMAAIGACCSSLQGLNLENLPHLTDVAMARIADGCSQIETLTLTRCKFSDEAVASFVTASGSALTDVALNSVRQAADGTLLALAKHSHNLLCLDASWSRRMSDEGLGFFADSCQQLRQLILFGCTQQITGGP